MSDKNLKFFRIYQQGHGNLTALYYGDENDCSIKQKINFPDDSMSLSDQNHCLAVICMCIDFYRSINWNSESWYRGDNLDIIVSEPEGGVDYPYYYPDENDNSIEFASYPPQCRSFDLIAHEAGHAIMATFVNPNKCYGEAAAISEAFADLTTIFARLYNPEEIKVINAANFDDLWSISLLTTIEDSGMVSSRKLRKNMHGSTSVALASRVFAIMAETYQSRYESDSSHEILFETAKEIGFLWMTAVSEAFKRKEPIFCDIRDAMLEKCTDQEISNIIESEFSFWGIS